MLMKYIILFLLPLVISCGQATVKDKDVVVAGVKTKPIPALTPANVHDQFTKKGFKLDKTSSGDMVTWTSAENNEMHEFKVITTATNTDKVLSVEASVFSMLTMDQSTKDFIGDVASIPYKYADPQKAKEWAVANFEKGGHTIIGDVNFEVMINSETRRVLKISAK